MRVRKWRLRLLGFAVLAASGLVIITTRWVHRLSPDLLRSSGSVVHAADYRAQPVNAAPWLWSMPTQAAQGKADDLAGRSLLTRSANSDRAHGAVTALFNGQPLRISLVAAQSSYFDCVVARDVKQRDLLRGLRLSITAQLPDTKRKVVLLDRRVSESSFDVRGQCRVTLPLPAATPEPCLLQIETASSAERAMSPSGIVIAWARLLARRWADAAPARNRRQKPCNVLIYMMDALRPDHLGCYGYERPTSPNLDAFAKHSLIFENAYANAPWTRPAVSSLLTGLLPSGHRAVARESLLADKHETMGELLQKQGYQTALVTANGNVGEGWGFNQGWDKYCFLAGSLDGAGTPLPAPGSEVTREVVAILERWRSDSRPWFVLAFAVDTHVPYRPSERARALFVRPGYSGPLDGSVKATNEASTRRVPVGPEDVQHMQDLYDAQISDNDREFGNLLQYLRKRGLYDKTLVIVLADHGEAFWEHHLFTHGHTLYQEEIRIPLLVKPPAKWQVTGEVKTTVSTVDVLPTVLSVALEQDTANLLGSDLLELARAERRGEPRRRHVISEIAFAPPEAADMAALIDDGRWKLLAVFRRLGASKPGRRVGLSLLELSKNGYREMRAPPDELRQRYYEAALIGTLKRQVMIGQTIAREPSPGSGVLSRETLENLRALGYIK